MRNDHVALSAAVSANRSVAAVRPRRGSAGMGHTLSAGSMTQHHDRACAS
jgi:hypothetical protein